MAGYLTDPNVRDWFTRLAWLDIEWDKARDGAEILVFVQAEALLEEMRKAYCSGTWLSVIVFAQAAIDAQLAELYEAGQGDGPVLNQIRFGPEFVLLRTRRNNIMHYEGGIPTISLADLNSDKQELFEEAQNAVRLAFAAVTENV